VTSVATSPSAPSHKPRILFVDDDPLILEGLGRSLFHEFHADTAEGPESGLEMLKKQGPYATVVSDMRMPGMDGAEFLCKVSTLAPDSIRVMLTGYSDLEAAVRAVNEGRIFRFLNKPISSQDLSLTLRACVAQYELARREKDLLENTLAGAVRVLSEVLNLANPAAFNKGARICQYVRHIAAKLGLPDTWQYEIAAMLSELGCLTLTPELLEAIHAGEHLTPENEKRYAQHPQIAHDLLVRIPRLELVAVMIQRQNDPPTDPALSLTPASESIRCGSNMLKVSLAFDHLLGTGSKAQVALTALSKNPAQYHAKMVEALRDFKMSQGSTEVQEVDVEHLRPGMILNQDLRSTAGILLAAKGYEISHSLAKSVRNLVENGSVKGTVMVTVKIGEAEAAKAAGAATS
jgi:response regulator RpfG family c-di-GMP phosphodiesterase